MKYLLICCFCVITQVCFSQPWTKVNSLPSVTFVALEKDNSILYAATASNIVYVSIDNGTSWAASTLGPSTINITCLALFGHSLYAGTTISGIFISSDSGKTWSHAGAGLLSVASFAEWRNNIYAVTLGTGVFVLNPVTHNWVPFNNDLPNYSVNVFNVINVNDTLIAAAGANGTFYRFDPAANKWIENYYFSVLRPGILVRELQYSQGAMLASTGVGTIFRSNNSTSAWHLDTVGLKRNAETTVTIGTGETNFYTIVNFALTGGSLLQKQDKMPGGDETWKDDGDFIPTGFTYAVKELGPRLFLCRSDGLFYRDLITGVNEIPVDDNLLSVYPNPSQGVNITVKSSHMINSIEVFNLSGACVFQAAVRKEEFQLPLLLPGVYIARITVNKKVKSCKVLVL